jgi:hypothetical protein
MAESEKGGERIVHIQGLSAPLTLFIHKFAEGVAKKNIGDTLAEYQKIQSVSSTVPCSTLCVSFNPIAFKIFLSHAFC